MNRLRALIREIHRRSLWQVVGIYLVGSWIGYQVILAVTDGLSLPDWVPPLAFILFVIGLPIVVATAFVNEGAPGLRPQDPSLLPDLGPLVPGDDDSSNARGSALAIDSVPISTAAAGSASRPALTWPRALGAGVVAFIVLGASAGSYAGLRVAGIGPFGSLIAKGALAADDALLLADFGGAAQDSLLTAALTEALRIDLGQSRTITLVQPNTVRGALERMERDPGTRLDEALAREVAERENIKAVLAGDARRVAGSWVVTARLISTAEGEELAAFRETARDSTALLEAVDRLSRRLRARVGESLRDVRASEPLAQVTTSSLDALRRYSQAVRLLNERRDNIRALRLLEEAVAIDTAFAMAYRKLAAELSNDQLERARMLDAATRAWRFSERLTENERLHANLMYQIVAGGDLDAAQSAGELLVERYPNDFAAANNLALVYGRRRDFARAAEYYRRAIAIDSSVASGPTNYAITLVDLGRLDEADSVISVYARRFPDGAPHLWQASIIAARGDYEAAYVQIMSGLDELPRGQQLLWGLRSAESAALVLGRVRAADALGERLQRVFGDDHDAHAYLFQTVLLTRADMRVRRQPPELAMRRIENTFAARPLDAVHPLDRPYPELASMYAEAGQPAHARRLLAEYAAVVPLEIRRVNAAAEEHALGRIALAEQRWSDAIRHLQSAIDAGECVRCHLEPLSHAFERAGEPDSAIAYAQRFVDTRHLFGFIQDRFDLVLVLERLGRLYEERGDRDAALRAWARITELWKDADPELQPRVRHAQQRIQMLSEAGG
jgi:eukaryotic-like serine/threonine-protein kinase